MAPEKPSYTRSQFRQASSRTPRAHQLLQEAETRPRSDPSGTRLRWAPSPRIVSAALMAVVIVAVMAGWAQGKTPNSGPSPAAPSFSSAARATPGSAPGGTGEVLVDVVGKVKKPGVVRLEASARVQDAIKAAGGALPGTDLSGLNLARRLSDGEQLRVGIEESSGSGTEAVAGADAAGAGAAGTSGQPADEGGAASAGGGKISINEASKQQLEQLPGVGESLAQRIVDYRQSQGRFQNLEDLKNVSGIGEKKYAALAGMIRL
ncbi:ComEA family DNA-binding protein [Varibaculum cambriense]|uniref:ComEA family DNA-binding protein n=1 Tax=Varibaculum cambriense TaxID=184870 RepID=UPI00290266C5|nr:ComEA family DNA-binding protein [Varibaculum cambriense]MDU1223944.1 ComEA family DNA-binding protein [Varibaculum cambriense]